MRDNRKAGRREDRRKVLFFSNPKKLPLNFLTSLFLFISSMAKRV
jgi:hypothetical protein